MIMQHHSLAYEQYPDVSSPSPPPHLVNGMPSFKSNVHVIFLGLGSNGMGGERDARMVHDKEQDDEQTISQVELQLDKK